MTREYDLFSRLPAAPPQPRDSWHREARRIAKRHAEADSVPSGALGRVSAAPVGRALTDGPQRHRGESRSRRPFARGNSPRALPRGYDHASECRSTADGLTDR
jgi:hypothetical protein